jgi:hypothetical protein
MLLPGDLRIPPKPRLLGTKGTTSNPIVLCRTVLQGRPDTIKDCLSAYLLRGAGEGYAMTIYHKNCPIKEMLPPAFRYKTFTEARENAVNDYSLDAAAIADYIIFLQDCYEKFPVQTRRHVLGLLEGRIIY